MGDERDVRRALRADILAGAYAPNQRLIEAELADRYGASRFVVRNTLMQLESAGLVELQPNRGARVREVPVDEAIEITEVRRAVEGLVAARAAARADAGDREELRRIEEAMRRAVASGDPAGYSTANGELHGTLRRIAAHATSDRILEQLNAQLVRHQFRLSLLPGRTAASLVEHLAVAEAVRSGDAAGAERAMHAHLDGVITALGGFR